MTADHWHLIFIHLPIIGTILSSFLLIAGLLIKNNRLKIISVSVIVVMSVLGFIVHETGPKTEISLTDLNLNQQAIQAHEAAARPAFIIHSMVGALSLIALALYSDRKKAFNVLGVIVVSLSLSAAGLMSYAGYLEGKIRHHELNAGNKHILNNYCFNGFSQPHLPQAVFFVEKETAAL